jgi:hypothetical protein
MKLKELPVSWWAARKLARLTADDLKNAQAPRLPVIVSLTSIPSRLEIIHLTIRSLLVQSYAAEKIILWLHEGLRDQLPRSLRELESDRFEISYVNLTCSHRKLIHSLELYPEKIIVTCDDDLMYDATWLQRLYQSHVQHPRDIIAHESRLITFTAPGQPAPYAEWKTEARTDITEPWLMPIGYGGVLYPPNCLYGDVQNRDLFLRLTPKADDLWFKAMSYLAGTNTRRSANPGKKPIPIIASQKDSLKKTNVRQDGNYQQWLALCKHYDF